MRGALILLILASVSVVAGSAPSVPVLRDVDLGVDASGLHTTADVYCPAEPIYPCQKAGSSGGESPIVLVYPGAAGPKDDFSGFASHAAAAGYTVMVLETLVTVNPFPPIFPESREANFPEATATAVALKWFKEQGEAVFVGEGGEDVAGGEYGGTRGYSTGDTLPCGVPDSDTVLLTGHSAGAAVVVDVLIANGTQPFTPLAGTLPVGPEDTPVYDEILGAFLFGFANLELPPDANRPALPEQRVLIANGDIDRITPRFEVTPNATDFETYITVENLDHFSIADRVFLVREGDEFSTLSRAEEVALVSDIGIAALGSMLCGPIEGASMDLPPYVLDATPAADASALEDWMTWLNS